MLNQLHWFVLIHVLELHFYLHTILTFNHSNHAWNSYHHPRVFWEEGWGGGIWRGLGNGGGGLLNAALGSFSSVRGVWTPTPPSISGMILTDSCYRNINFYFLWEKLTYDVKCHHQLCKKFVKETIFNIWRNKKYFLVLLIYQLFGYYLGKIQLQSL